MSATWLCRRMDVADDASPESKVLTVGQVVKLKCSGSGTPQLKADSLRLDLPAEQKYALKVLKTLSLNESGAELLVTTYQTGAVSLSDVKIGDGTHSISLTGIEFQVASVVQVEQGKQPEPFPAWDSIWLWWPLHVWLWIAVLLTSFLLVLTHILRAASRQREFLRMLKDRATHLTPADQLNKDIRNIGKLTDFAQRHRQLEESVGWYLALKLRVNVLDQLKLPTQRRGRAIAKVVLRSRLLKRDADLRTELGEQVEAFFREVGAIEASSSNDVAHWDGLEQLARRVIHVTERIAQPKVEP